MQIVNIDLMEFTPDELAHAPKSGIVYVAVIRDESNNPLPRLLDAPLREPDEFYVVIL